MDGRKEVHPFKQILLDNKHYWHELIVIVLLGLLTGALKTRSATLWGEAVNFGVNGSIGEMLNSAVWMIVFIGLDAVRTIFYYTLIGRTTEGMFKGIRLRMFDAMARANMATIEQSVHSGDVTLRACDDVERLSFIFSDSYANYIRVISQAVFSIVVCTVLSWRLAIVYFLFLPLSMFLLNSISKHMERLQKEMRSDAGQSADVALSAIAGIQAVKVFALENEMDSRFAVTVDKAYTANIKVAHISMRMSIIKYIVNVMQVMVLFVMGAWMVSNDLITIGTVMTFVLLSVYVTEAFGMMDMMIVRIKEGAAYTKRIYDIYNLPREAPGEKQPLTDGEECIRFDNVTFSYDRQTILSGLNLAVKQGQKVALVGESGSGKSTIIRLICHLYGIEDGKIRLFGVDSEEISLQALRNNLALVTQEPYLFEGTFLENVRFGRMEATEKEVVEALRAANLWDFVSTLPEGLHTTLGEFGSRLSGGQRQRLSIARALLRNARLVLLDEPTSALDTESEREIQHAMENLLRGRTAVIVAHRLTTVQNVDYLYCIKKGRVVEEGPPSELYNRHGYYYKMCRMQGVNHNA